MVSMTRAIALSPRAPHKAPVGTLIPRAPHRVPEQQPRPHRVPHQAPTDREGRPHRVPHQAPVDRRVRPQRVPHRVPRDHRVRAQRVLHQAPEAQHVALRQGTPSYPRLPSSEVASLSTPTPGQSGLVANPRRIGPGWKTLSRWRSLPLSTDHPPSPVRPKAKCIELRALRPSSLGPAISKRFRRRS